MTIALRRPLVISVAAIAVGLAASLALPFVVHLLPAQAGPPAGARLLPIFYAVLVLALRAGAVPALAVALLAPPLNAWATGMPAGAMLPTLMAELALFALAIVAARRLLPSAARFAGPIAYLGAALAVRSLLAPGFAPLATLQSTVLVAWPGLVMLLAIGAVVGVRRSDATLR